MIEKIVLDHLSGSLACYMEFPADPPAEFVIIERTGSGMSNQIMTATFAFQSYGESLLKACELNEKVKDAVFSLMALSKIGSVRLVSDYNYPDTVRKEYRYQAIFQIKYYKE